MNQFVFPEHPKHAPYRILTKDFDMLIGNGNIVRHHPTPVAAEIVFPEGTPAWVLSQKDVEGWFFSNGGVNLCNEYLYHDPRHIRPGGIRLRRGVHPMWSSVAQAFEILTYGVGILRPVQTRQEGGLSCMLGLPALPKVGSKYARVELYHLLQWMDELNPGTPWLLTKEMFESTNMVLADTYGELEQLMRRCKDVSFLEMYLKDLKYSTTFRPHFVYDPREEMMMPDFLMDRPRGVVQTWLNHINTGCWDGAPDTIEELLERTEYVLSVTIIDPTPLDVITDYTQMELYFHNEKIPISYQVTPAC